MAKVYVGVPNQNWIHKFVTRKLIEIFVAPGEHKLIYDDTSDKPTDNCRNQIVKRFLEHDADYLLFLDADNPPMKSPLELVGLDKDILALPTPIWYSKVAEKNKGERPIVWNCFDFVDTTGGWREHVPKEGLQEIDAAGTGCMIIARRVLERVRPAFYREWTKDGTVSVGSDLLFCKRAKEAGFRCWAHYDYPAMHFKERELVEIHQLLMARDISAANRDNVNTSKYWDRKWAEDNGAVLTAPEPVFSIVAREIKRIASKARKKICVLDFGCGKGDLLALLAKEPKIRAEGIDFSRKAVELAKERKLTVRHGKKPPEGKKWDVIVATNVLQNLENDRAMLRKFFEVSSRVIYTVPNNCMPPGIEQSNLRVYTQEYVQKITPHLRKMQVVEDHLLVIAEKEEVHGRTQ
jgi:hypothetical protein